MNANITYIIILISSVLSCDSFRNNSIYPITYKGIDTIYYPEDPTIDHSIQTRILQITTIDSVLLSFETNPFAPVDSSYGIHGSFRQHEATYKDVEGHLFITWKSDLKTRCTCINNNSSALQFISEREMLLDISKDTICIGDVICVKQQIPYSTNENRIYHIKR